MSDKKVLNMKMNVIFFIAKLNCYSIVYCQSFKGALEII